MTIMIKSLTHGQEELLTVYREKWLKISLSTEPLNLEMAKKAIIKCYTIAGLKPPTQFYTSQSPISALKTVVDIGLPYEDLVCVKVRNIIKNKIATQIVRQLSNKVQTQAFESWDPVWGQVQGEVWSQII